LIGIVLEAAPVDNEIDSEIDNDNDNDNDEAV
jgi:hypothetical protein